MDTPWQFQLLGKLSAQRGDLAVARFATSRIGALLARLVLSSGSAHSREELIELLWPDGDQDAGRLSLRVALASLRRQIEPPDVPPGSILIADRTVVRLNPLACRSDVAAFEAALKSADRAPDAQARRRALDQAVGLYAGELLPGFWDEWILDERERLAALYDDACERRLALPAATLTAALALPPDETQPGRAPLRGFPLQFTRFFGRDEECAQAAAWLREPDVRLLTLSGPGGAGKTRLSAQIAQRAASDFAGPVCFVPLADLGQASLIPDAVAQALGLPRTGETEPLDQVVAALASQPPALLVLDNYEHLVEGGGPFVFSLLSRLPTLTCLVTSRRRLGLPGEREFPVPPLSLPDADAPMEQVSPAASVRLFVDRAQAARPDFQLTRGNASAVADLCRRLEGLPLAIELVAARASALTLAQMAERLAQRFDQKNELLTSRRGDKGGRHRSLWAAMAWSYDLLSPDLRTFFTRLSVFRGGCTSESAEAVCGEARAGEFLTLLRERSLLTVAEEGGALRFRLPESLREFALDRLGEGGEAAAARARHRAFFLALAEEAEPKLMGDESGAWLARLEAEHDNLRAALEACAAEKGGGDEDAAQAGLRLSVALARFWQTRGYLSEARERLAGALGRAGAEGPTAHRGWALRWAGLLAYYQGDYVEARARAEEARALFGELGETRGSGWALVVLGNVAACQGALGEARSYFEEAMTCFRPAGDKLGMGGVLNNLGNMLMGEGDLEGARPLYEEALELQRAAGNRPASAIMLTNLGLLAYYRDDLGEARRRLEESLALRTEIGIRPDQSGYTLVGLVGVALREGNTAEARAHLIEGLRLCRECGDKPSVANLLDFSGRLLLAEGRALGAARALGASSRLREETGVVREGIEQPRYEASVAAVRAGVPAPAFEAAWAEGRALTWDQAVDEALGDGDGTSGKR